MRLPPLAPTRILRESSPPHRARLAIDPELSRTARRSASRPPARYGPEMGWGTTKKNPRRRCFPPPPAFHLAFSCSTMYLARWSGTPALTLLRALPEARRFDANRLGASISCSTARLTDGSYKIARALFARRLVTHRARSRDAPSRVVIAMVGDARSRFTGRARVADARAAWSSRVSATWRAELGAPHAPGALPLSRVVCDARDLAPAARSAWCAIIIHLRRARPVPPNLLTCASSASSATPNLDALDELDAGEAPHPPRAMDPDRLLGPAQVLRRRLTVVAVLVASSRSLIGNRFEAQPARGRPPHLESRGGFALRL